MIHERRLKPKKLGPSSELPVDFLKQVRDIFTTHFDEILKQLAKLNYACTIHSSGEIYQEEIVLRVSFLPDGKLAATTFHASHDFDPKASAPTAEQILSACVDVLGSFISSKMDDKKSEDLEKFATTSLNELEDVPFEWTLVKSGAFKVYLRFDRAHPGLEKMTDEWLKKNDPDFEMRAEQEEAKAMNVFRDDDDDSDNGPKTIH